MSGQPPFIKTKVSPVEKSRIKNQLFQINQIRWTPKTEQYCDYRLDGESASGWIRVKQYTNGTLYIQSLSQAQLDNVATQLSLKGQISSGTSSNATVKAASSSDKVLNIETPYIGTDESGKGDYFGPLVSAGVYVDDKTKAALEKMGVMDSKKLSDTQISSLAERIEATVGNDAFSVNVLMPETYNADYANYVQQNKNLNHLLSDSHAVVIKDLLSRHVDCKSVLVDQFGKESYMINALNDPSLTIHQAHRAEAYTAVAAASILARHYFVQALGQLSSDFGTRLPLGAGSPVLQAGKRWVQNNGRESLVKVAKTHFKTTQQL